MDPTGAPGEGSVVVDLDGLDALIKVLAGDGHRVIGPVVRHETIVHGPLGGASDLPVGWHDEQSPGRYRLRQGGDGEVFGWAVGPESPKRDLYPPSEVLWRGRRTDEGVVTEASGPPAEAPLALVGARPCELAAVEVLDRVLGGGRQPDPGFSSRRRDAVVVVAECTAPSASCFCTSMGTGPAADHGFDLALVELAPGRAFLVRAASARGRALLEALAASRPASTRAATGADLEARGAALEAAAGRISRHLDTDGLAERLAASVDDPRWEAVADRCLACGNCTMVCPTCFCSDVDDTTDLAGGLERRRHWASCFDLRHSYLHGGFVRDSKASRYRQWATHKLSTWHDQFGTSGCVGCGRCITWCPVGIDLTAEVAALAPNGAGADAPAGGTAGGGP